MIFDSDGVQFAASSFVPSCAAKWLCMKPISVTEISNQPDFVIRLHLAFRRAPL